MTTKKFSAIALPYPRYSCEIGCFDLRRRKTINLSTWLPNFSRTIQLVEVNQQAGNYSPSISNIAHSYTVIENARLELFLRRDFLSKFVDHGTIYLSKLDDASGETARISPYQLYTSHNKITLVMNERQYRRFGLIAKKINNDRVDGSKSYKIEIDLKDEKLRKSNKFHDRMVMSLRRLEPVSKLYFRFVPKDAVANQTTTPITSMTNMTITNANDKSVEFFQYVMDEYAIDGFEPVPLTSCVAFNQRLQHQWTNYAQSHPSLNVLAQLGGSKSGDTCIDGLEQNSVILEEVVDIINWLGFQMLSLDCERQEILSSYPSGQFDHHENRMDVSCALFSGLFDQRQVQDNLGNLFVEDNLSNMNHNGCVLRALILQQAAAENSGAVLLQHCSAPNSIIVVGMSAVDCR